MKKFTKVFAGTLALSMILASCGGGAAKEPTGDVTKNAVTYPADTENVVLNFSWWGSDARHEALKATTDLYTKKHPNVTFKVDYAAFDGWQTKVTTQLSGKTEPDVLQVNYNWVHSFNKGKNVFYDINQLSEFIDLTQWDKEQIDAMTVGGELAAVPHGVTARANLYNKTLFADNGLEYPKTYEEMIGAGKLIGANNTEIGTGNKYVQTNIGKHSTDLFIAQMLYNATGKVMQENGTVSYTVEEVKATFDKYKEFEDSGAMPTFNQEDPIQNESNPVWTSGNSGSVYEWIGTMDKYLASFKGGEAKEEIGVANYVTENEGDKIKVFIKPSLGYAISKNTKQPAVAADFINFMFTDAEAIKTIGTSLGVSSNKAAKAVQESEGMIKGAMKEGFDLLATYEQVVMDPYFEDENVRGQRYKAIEAFRTGSQTSEEAAKAYIEKQQTELDKLYK